MSNPFKHFLGNQNLTLRVFLDFLPQLLSLSADAVSVILSSNEQHSPRERQVDP